MGRVALGRVDAMLKGSAVVCSGNSPESTVRRSVFSPPASDHGEGPTNCFRLRDLQCLAVSRNEYFVVS